MIRNDNKKIVLYLSVFLIFLITNSLFAYKPSSEYTKYKHCLSNLKVLQDAIEMYNMDNKESIDNLNEENLKSLISKGYLKGISSPTDKCKYLSKNGEVYCKYHGGVDYKKIRPDPEFAQFIDAFYEAQNKKEISYIFERCFVFIFFLLAFYSLVKFIKWVSSSFKPEELYTAEYNKEDKKQS